MKGKFYIRNKLSKIDAKTNPASNRSRVHASMKTVSEKIKTDVLDDKKEVEETMAPIKKVEVVSEVVFEVNPRQYKRILIRRKERMLVEKLYEKLEEVCL